MTRMIFVRFTPKEDIERFGWNVRLVPTATTQGTRCVQSCFFLADLRDAFFLLAFFFSVVRFLEATFFATFFFLRELGFFAPIVVATLSQTAAGAAVAVAAASSRSSGMS